MENIKYIGEHLLPGVIGKSSIYISFVMYLVSTLLHMSKSARCINIAKYVFTIASICLLVTISVLFYIIYNHYFEYSYVFAHSSKEMPLHFIVSCFWEGQEGSFLLWAFWQALLTFIVLRFLPNIWRPKFMIVVSISQAFIVSMILGVEILGTKIGTSPFMLLRDIMSAVPVFKDPNYIKKFVIDGNGLNPLLQNYWMVIHPPVLFLGYASTLIPFAIVVAGLLMRKYKELVSLVMPWLLFSVLTLGIGIIMGAFWAYEALSFGGFWAWDPVENASLVPWLVLVGALHATIAFTKTSRSYKTVVILTLLSYILVLYASFLTRSGILGDTSVHSFTDLGMSMQLAIFVITFLIASIIVLSLRFKQLPVVISEEKISSREFWLFIGAVLLFLSSFQIIVVTSIPVINKLFSTNIAPPTDIISHYNKFQIPFAIMAMFIAGFAQFLNYKTTNMSKFYSRVGVYAVVSLIISLLFSFYVGVYKNPFFVVLIFSATLCLLSNIRFVRNYFKNKKALQTGAITAHIGFAVMLLGALISTSTRQVISFNAENYDYGDGFDEKSRGENMLLIKGQTKKMSKYLVSYVEENAVKEKTFYKVNFKELDKKGDIKTEFNLFPIAIVEKNMQGLIAEPDRYHNFLNNLYVHVSSVPVKENKTHMNDDDDYEEAKNYSVKIGDVIELNGKTIKIKGIKPLNSLYNIDIDTAKKDVAIALIAEVSDKKDVLYKEMIEPIYFIKNQNQFNISKKSDKLGLKLYFNTIDPKKETFGISVRTKKAGDLDYIILKAIIFPYINLFWLGTIIMSLGVLIAFINRVKNRPGVIKLDPK